MSALSPLLLVSFPTLPSFETSQLQWLFGATLQAAAALLGVIIIIFIFWYDKAGARIREESERISRRVLGQEMVGVGATEISLAYTQWRWRPLTVRVDITERLISPWKEYAMRKWGGQLTAPNDPTENIVGGLGKLGYTVLRRARRALIIVLSLGVAVSVEAILGLLISDVTVGSFLAFLLVGTFLSMILALVLFALTHLTEGQVSWFFAGSKGGTTFMVDSGRF